MKMGLRCITLVLIVNFLTGCKHNRFEVDTSDVNLKPIVFKRLDKDVFSLTANNINDKTIEFQKKYSNFYGRYVSSILNHGGVNDSLYTQNVLKFIHDKDMNAAYANIAKTYTDNDVELLGDEMTEAVKRFTVFFPKRKLPQQFVMFMSGFNYNIVSVDSTLGVGLDMYLGSENIFYSMLQYPKYKRHSMSKPYIIPNAIYGWMITEFDNTDPVNNLLNHMIFYGKIHYLTDIMLPDTHDSLKIGYTTAQLNYCNKYEKNLWGFFAKENKLYDNDLKLIAEFTNEAPFTSSISKECPAGVIKWIGWQIIKSYMEHNEEVTLEELMNEKDAQKILAKSKYKP